MVYVYLIAANVLLGFMADLCIKHKQRVLCWLFLLGILALDTVIIGLRDFEVGFDTSVYVGWYYDLARDIDSISEFFDPDLGGDKGFLVLGWVAVQILELPQTYLLVIEFFIMFWILWGLYEYKKVIDFSIGWFMLLFWVFMGQETFNLMRQFCAMSLMFFGFSQFMQKRYKTWAAFQIVAFFFHSTSPLFLLVPIFYYLSDKDKKKRDAFLLCVCVGIIFIITSYALFLQLAGGLGIVNETYTDRYGQGSTFEYSGSSISIRYVLRFVLPTLLILFARRREVMKKEEAYMLIALFATGAMLEQTQFVMVYFFRLAYYIYLAYFIYLSKLYKYNKELSPLLIVYMLFMMLYARGNYHGSLDDGRTFEYSSMILGL